MDESPSGHLVPRKYSNLSFSTFTHLFELDNGGDNRKIYKYACVFPCFQLESFQSRPKYYALVVILDKFSIVNETIDKRSETI